MFDEKCLRPCLYTRSKSECFSSRAELCNLAPACAAGGSTLGFGASAPAQLTILHDN